MTNVNEDVEKAELSHIAGGNIKWCSCFENSLFKQRSRLHNIEVQGEA